MILVLGIIWQSLWGSSEHVYLHAFKGKSKKTILEKTHDRTNTLFTKSEDHIAIVDNSDGSVRIVDLCSQEPVTLDSWKLRWERRVSIMFVLEKFLVIGYFDDFSLSLKAFSLSSVKLLWENRNTIDCTNLMRSYHQDINSFGNFIAVYRYKSITLYPIGDACVKQLNLTDDFDVHDGTFQYPWFSAFSGKHFALPFQVLPQSRPDQMVLVKHRLYCLDMEDFTV